MGVVGTEYADWNNSRTKIKLGQEGGGFRGALLAPNHLCLQKSGPRALVRVAVSTCSPAAGRPEEQEGSVWLGRPSQGPVPRGCWGSSEKRPRARLAGRMQKGISRKAAQWCCCAVFRARGIRPEKGGKTKTAFLVVGTACRKGQEWTKSWPMHQLC